MRAYYGVTTTKNAIKNLQCTKEMIEGSIQNILPSNFWWMQRAGRAQGSKQHLRCRGVNDPSID